MRQSLGSTTRIRPLPFFCAGCDQPFTEHADRGPDGACLRCGVTGAVWYEPGKEFQLRITWSRSRSRPSGGGRWVAQSTREVSTFTAEGREHYVERTIDRLSDEYHERIIDRATGDVVREVHEPLSAHRGHGTPRKHTK
jgi:hypothetical protein